MKIIVGGLIHDRPQVAAYLRHLRLLDVDGHDVEWWFVQDGMDAVAIAALPWEVEDWPATPNVMRDGLRDGERPWTRHEPDKVAAYRHLARLRNALREEVLDGDADALLTIDSDIIVPPDLLQRLAGCGKPWVSGLVSNRPGDPRIWNVVKWTQSRAGQPAIRHFQTIGNGPRGEPWPGPEGSGGDPRKPHERDPLIVGAVCLYRREVLEGAYFVEHRCGEDIGFGARAIEAGFRGWYLPIVCEHLMTEEMLAEHEGRCEICRP